MSLTIYQMPHSPYCIPITAALDGLGVGYEIKNIATHTREEVIRRSDGEYYQVPMLDHDGELVMESSWESIDIARYVDRVFAEGRLFPEAIEEAHLALIEHVENEMEMVGFQSMDPMYLDTIEDVLVRTMIIRHKERKFGKGCVEEWRARNSELFERFVEMLKPAEAKFGENAFLFGDAPVYADYALLGVIENATYKGWNTLPNSYKNVARWHGELRAWRFG